MAMDSSVRAELTAALIKSLRFDRQVVGVGPDGELKTKKTPPGTKDWVIRDTKQSGFMVRVYPSKMVYQVQRKMGLRRDPDQKGQRSTSFKRVVGSVADLKLNEARATAQEWLGLMGRGIDPVQQLRTEAREQARSKARDDETFGVFFTKYASDSEGLKDEGEDRKKAGKWMANSPLWKASIHDLDFSVLDASLSPLFSSAQGLSKAPKWGPDKPGLATAWKIFRHTSAAYSAFVGQNYRHEFARGASPFATLRKKKKWPQVGARQKILDLEREGDRDWLRRLVSMRDSSQKMLGVFADYLLLSVIWGGRRRETQLLRWDDVDLDRRTGRFVAANTKSGKEHYFPLTPWAIEILGQRRERNREMGRDYGWVFPSAHHDKPVSDHTSALRELKKATGEWITAHDLRRTVATETAGLSGSDSMLVSMTLNHSGGPAAISQRYVQRRVKLLRPVFEARERRLRGIAGLSQSEPEANPIDALIEFLHDAKQDPAEAFALTPKVEGILLMLK